mgnify:CR=1 FL=1
MDIVVELPDHDLTSGGIMRTLKVVMELPHYSPESGGIRDNILIAETLSMHVRFQNLSCGYPDIKADWTVGFPDNTFPKCDICITYSDNPYIEELVELPQIGRVYILMLSYGMNLPVEKSNIHNSKLKVLCSTKKLEKAIKDEGVEVFRLGIGLDMSEMYQNNIERKNYLAILYNNMGVKKYQTAVKVADILYQNKIIDGVISFGRSDGYNKYQHPKGLIKHYSRASRDEVREIFNTCKCFLMPSVSEGLNLTPIESALCGCPAVLCDGAIGEIFFDKINCLVAAKEDISDMVNKCKHLISNFEIASPLFQKDMNETIKNMTWNKVFDNLKKILC